MFYFSNSFKISNLKYKINNMNTEEKLDNFSKILLATSTINYMACTLEGVRKDYETIVAMNDRTSEPEKMTDKVMKDGLQSKNEMMADTLKRLCDTIEDLGNYMDGHDIVCPIDQRVYKAPLEILLHGMDEVENDYEEEEAVN